MTGYAELAAHAEHHQAELRREAEVRRLVARPRTLASGDCVSLGEVVAAVRARLSRPQQAAPAAAEAPVDQLERLSALHDQGALTDQEFQAMKSSLLP